MKLMSFAAFLFLFGICCRSGLRKNDDMLWFEHEQAGDDYRQHARWPDKVVHEPRNGISACGNGKRRCTSCLPAHEKGSQTWCKGSGAGCRCLSDDFR